MERQISEKFDVLSYRLEVEKSDSGTCTKCFFYQHQLACYRPKIQEITGECMRSVRQDGNDVVFRDKGLPA